MSESFDMDAPVTRREMHDAFAQFGALMKSWLDALEARLTAVMMSKADAVAMEKRLMSRADADAMERRLAQELRGQVGGSADELATRLVAVDQHYQDLPARVRRLEAKVFAPSKPRRRAQRSR